MKKLIPGLILWFVFILIITHSLKGFVLAIAISIAIIFVVFLIILAISNAQETKRREQERILQKKKWEEEWLKETERREQERLLEEKHIEEQRLFEEKVNDARKNDPATFFRLVLPKYQINTLYADEILGIEADLPTKGTIRQLNLHNYLKYDGTVKVQLDKDLPKLYEKHLYTLCLNTIHDAFAADTTNLAKSIVYNGFVEDYSPRTGRLERYLILSLMVDRETFMGIDITHVDPKQCFKALKGVSAAKLIDIVPVQPVLQINKEDHRFIEGKNVAINEGTNLAAMPWDDFEQLVREIFELEFSQNGGEVHVTQASRDGGVDAVVFDPDPLRGGKIVIQAKRYTNTVPVSAIRDLYGTVINEGANSGIIITTSDYGRDSYEFAKDKPLKLLNGGHLLALLNKNGRKGYINLAEAKNIVSEKE